MNLRKLSDRELENLINNTNDLKLLDKAELEYINRHTEQDRVWEINEDDLDADIMAEIDATWKPS